MTSQIVLVPCWLLPCRIIYSGYILVSASLDGFFCPVTPVDHNFQVFKVGTKQSRNKAIKKQMLVSYVHLLIICLCWRFSWICLQVSRIFSVHIVWKIFEKYARERFCCVELGAIPFIAKWSKQQSSLKPCLTKILASKLARHMDEAWRVVEVAPSKYRYMEHYGKWIYTL